jgi:hypothetical protein
VAACSRDCWARSRYCAGRFPTVEAIAPKKIPNRAEDSSSTCALLQKFFEGWDAFESLELKPLLRPLGLCRFASSGVGS